MSFVARPYAGPAAALDPAHASSRRASLNMEKVMSPISFFREKVGGSHGPAADNFRDYRQRRADDERARAEAKRLQMADQRSDFNDAKARIRAWETFHGLRLPMSPTHPVLRIIAAATQLTLGDVLAEQRLRSAHVPEATV